MRRLLPWLLLAALILAGCAAPDPDEGVPPEILAIGSPSQGERLFYSGGSSGVPCSSCHTLDGITLVGPSLQGIAVQAAMRVEGQDAETYLRNSILAPAEFIVPDFQNLMNQAYATSLSEEDISNLVAFLLTQQ